MTVLKIFLSVFCVLPCLSLDPDLKGLKLVHLLYRHGDRMPINVFPTDPYKDPSDWPVGWSQLTSLGKAEHFQLGQWIRARYDGFLSSNYSEQEIYVRSTDVDRTLMSAQANLAGLYPPQGYWQWNHNIDWQPIPIHTVPQTEDYLLSSHADCPRFVQLHEEIEQGKFMQDIYDENKELFQYISTNAGENITDIVHLDYIFDTLLIESIYNKTLPEWTKSVFPGGKFEELRDLSFTIDTYNHEMKRLKGGPFVKEIVQHFDQVESNNLNPPNRKMFMYSGHDTTVAPILHTLGVFDIKAPPYASMIIIELFDRSGLVVRVSYKNTTDQPPTILTIPGCDELCPLHQFKDLTESVRPVDVREECGLVEGVDPAVQKVILLAAVSSVCLALVVLTAVLMMVCRRRKEEGSRYQRIQQADVD